MGLGEGCAVIALYGSVMGLVQRAGPGSTPYSAERASDHHNSTPTDTRSLGG